MVKPRAFAQAVTTLLLAFGPALAAALEPPIPNPAETISMHPAYTLLNRLPQLPGQFMVLQSSSHNKTGHNGDENWPLYKDEHGDHVIFDAAGPGCVRSIWGTHFAEDAFLKFYFDGGRVARRKPHHCLRRKRRRPSLGASRVGDHRVSRQQKKQLH